MGNASTLSNSLNDNNINTINNTAKTSTETECDKTLYLNIPKVLMLSPVSNTPLIKAGTLRRLLNNIMFTFTSPKRAYRKVVNVKEPKYTDAGLTYMDNGLKVRTY